MEKKETKLVNIRVPIDLVNRMAEYREQEGASMTFQLTKGAEMFLSKKESK